MDDRDYWPAQSDEALIDEARRGHIESFNQLVLRYQSMAHNVAYRIMGETESAADVTQDSFLKAYQRLHQYRSDGGSFRSWLARIVTNTCYDALRRGRRHRTQVVEVDEDASGYEWQSGLRDRHESPDDIVLRQEVAASIQAAIDRLPLDQRTVLILSDVEGFDYQDIAAITKTPLGTVKSRLARARARVRDTLRKSHPGESMPQPMEQPTLAGRHVFSIRAGA